MRATLLHAILCVALATGAASGAPAIRRPPATVSVPPGSTDLGPLVAGLGRSSPVRLAVSSELAERRVTAVLRGVRADHARQAVALLYGFTWRRERQADGPVELLIEPPAAAADRETRRRAYHAAVRTGLQERLARHADRSDIPFLPSAAAQDLDGGRHPRLSSDPKTRAWEEKINQRFTWMGCIGSALPAAAWDRLLDGKIVLLDRLDLPETAKAALAGLLASSWPDAPRKARVAMNLTGVRNGDAHLQVTLFMGGGGDGFGTGLDARARERARDALGDLMAPGLPSSRLPQKAASARVVPAGFRWRQPEGQLGEALVQLGAALGIAILSDCHTRAPLDLPDVAGLAEGRAVAALAKSFGSDWAVAPGGIYLLRSRRWLFDDEADIPDATLTRWRVMSQSEGRVPTEVLLEMACLSDAQIPTLMLEVPALAPLERILNFQWAVLRFYGRLPELFRFRAERGWLPLSSLAPELTAPLRDAAPLYGSHLTHSFPDVLKITLLPEWSLNVWRDHTVLNFRTPGDPPDFYGYSLPQVPYPGETAPAAGR